MKITKENSRLVRFPVGAIGAGCIGISGEGRLADWEIFNAPGKGCRNGLSHFAVRAEKNGKILDARILNGDLDYDLTGGGWGPAEETLSSLPHFRDCVFDGRFPVGDFSFSDPEFPAKVYLSAMSPFIPGESDLSSMPAAIFEITLENTFSEALDFAAVGVLGNFSDTDGAENHFSCGKGHSGILLKSGKIEDPVQELELALTTDEINISYQEYLFRGGWRDNLEVYWHDLNTPGPLTRRSYPPHKKGDKREAGVLAVHFHLAPGEKKVVRFILSWYMPKRKMERNYTERLLKLHPDVPEIFENYYARITSSAFDAAGKIFQDYERITREIRLFCDTLHASTLPAAALEGAAENLSVLVTPTCIRAEDGTFWGWEGIGSDRGSCPGTCQHVWNYAQALSLLFPDLERSIRKNQADAIDINGKSHFRTCLPLALREEPERGHACADGSFGEVMKIFREWKVSGDTEWLKTMWPAVKKYISWAWSPKNTDQWDPGQTGVLTGRMHHTLDMELFGPSGWLEGHYLGALKAASLMALPCGDPEFGALCRELFLKGKNWTEKNLFNGEYYFQKVDLDNTEQIRKFFLPGEENPYIDREHGELKYQIGEGCEIDSVLAQFYASFYGIGELFQPERVKKTLASIFRWNWKSSMRNIANTWRTFSLNDEAGTMICVWPEGRRKPVIPLPYNTETMTGFEWAAACQMVSCGLEKEGRTLAEAIRRRFHGENRNPWNEFECGNNYARSMASYGMLQAYTGFRYDMTVGKIGFSPVTEGPFRCFWSLGSIWGNFRKESDGTFLEILHGSADLKEFAIPASGLLLNGEKLDVLRKDGSLFCTLHLEAGDVLKFEGVC